jgi:hypothetical protein
MAEACPTSSSLDVGGQMTEQFLEAVLLLAIGSSVFFWISVGLSDILSQKRHERAMERIKYDG